MNESRMARARWLGLVASLSALSTGALVPPVNAQPRAATGAPAANGASPPTAVPGSPPGANAASPPAANTAAPPPSATSASGEPVKEIPAAIAAEIAGVAAIDIGTTEDEITVRGSRNPRTVVTIDREIERTTMNFYDLLNEVVASKEYQVDCAWGTSEERGIGESMIRRRYCFAGYQLEELRLVMEAREDAQAIAEGAEGAPDVAFVYEPNQEKLREKEEEFANVIIEAMLAYPALMVAGEELTRLHAERQEHTGGAPALDAHAAARQRAREEARGGGRRR